MSSDELPSKLGPLVDYLDRGPLKKSVAELELALEGCETTDLPAAVAAQGVTEELLRSALAARDAFGKINDVIHASAIALALPHLLEPGEKLKRPSLAAGNTPDRLYDVETDRRIAEFKFAGWDGHDGGRQKTTVKDLARLAAVKTDRVAQLYVMGERPIRWLRTTTSSVKQQIKGYPAELAAFEAAFGDPDLAVSAFVAGPAAHVELVDIEQRLPALAKTVS